MVEDEGPSAKQKVPSQKQSQESEVVRRKKKYAAFIEDEAGLGSDDEEHDIVKQINKNAAEENEEGMDDELDGFIDHRVKDDDEIADPNGEAHAKFMADINQDEQAQLKIAMEAAVFGHNRKRQFQEEEDLDEREQMRLERIQERQEFDQDEMAKHL